MVNRGMRFRLEKAQGLEYVLGYELYVGQCLWFPAPEESASTAVPPCSQLERP